MIAYIPARGGSKRIPRKNIKEFFGKPIILHVIDALQQLNFIKGICVSTDDAEILRVAKSAGAITLEKRAPCLANDEADFGDLIREDIQRYADTLHDQEILFVLPTAALVPLDVYRSAYECYLERTPEILMSCIEYPSSPCWAMVEKEDGYWGMLFPDNVQYSSQNLPRMLVDAGLFYFFRLEIARKYSDPKLVKRLLPFVVDSLYAVDVDSPEEWDILETKYQVLKNTSQAGYHDG